MTQSIDDAKLAFYREALGVSNGDVGYLEHEWLRQETGAEGSIQDLWMLYLTANSGAVSDRIMEWLEGMGYNDSLPDAELAAYLAGGIGGGGAEGGDLLMPQVMVVGTPLLTPYGVAV